MSLVNDALRRARLVQPQATGPRPIPRPLPNVTPVMVHPNPGVGFPRITLAIVLVIVATVLAQWLWIRPAAPQPKTHSSHAEATTRAASTASGAVHGSAPLLLETNSTAGPAADRVHVSATHERPDVSPPPAPDPVKPELPALKLQAIIYNPSQPSAMIDGQTLFLGDSLKGFRLVQVTPNAATLQGSTGKKVLRLE